MHTFTIFNLIACGSDAYFARESRFFVSARLFLWVWHLFCCLFCLFCSYNMCPLIHLGVCLDADCVVLIMLGWLCCVGYVDWTGCAAGFAVPVMLCRLCCAGLIML